VGYVLQLHSRKSCSSHSYFGGSVAHTCSVRRVDKQRGYIVDQNVLAAAAALAVAVAVHVVVEVEAEAVAAFPLAVD